jgi:peptidoglycan/xylan/chitin deacetylase (PgdA/CDA1 family)
MAQGTSIAGIQGPPRARLLRRRIAPALRAVGETVLANGAMRRAALRLATARGRALVLIYHRVHPNGPAAHEIVPSLPSALAHQQIEALGELGDIVPLAELVRDLGTPQRRVKFSVTFDDDEPGHVRVALPLVRSLHISATFFLAGRAMHGMGPHWWVTLERLIVERGLREACRELGVTAASPRELASRCEGTPIVNRLDNASVATSDVQLDVAGIRALVAGDMEIGFHTVRHLVLPTLPARELEDALTHGRRELAEVVGAPICFLAYPHGQASVRVARAAQAAGYDAAFASGGRPVSAQADRFLLGRWEPGAVTVDEFVAGVALRLNRSAAVQRR